MGSLYGTMRSAAPDALSSERKANVLVVDDDAGVANGIGRILVQRGFAVDIAADGAAALERIESQTYDVMVLDLRMANLDGLEVLRALRSRPNPPETILHSAFLDVPTTVEAMKCGVSDVIEKPVSPNVLGDRVLYLVQKRQSSRVDMPGPATGAAALETDPAQRLLGETPAIRSLRDQIRRISQFREVSVLIEGHTGTGKELVAEAIHALTARQEPFVSVNCAAVPDHLFESELFGHEAGAFTSARGARAGLFEEAGHGTIFLDEIGEMPASVQPKLLRVLETREFRRVGGNRSRRLSARVISATNRPLSGAPDDALRSDLYFRLAGYTIVTPRLCERANDIPILAVHFLAQFAARYGQTQARFTPAALDSLGRYDWPGNVRELRLVVENAAMLASPGPIDAASVDHVLYTRSGESVPQPPEHSGSFPASAVVGPGVTLPDLERELIIGAFTKYSPNLSKTAKYLGIPRSTLRDKLRKFGVL
jgi:two-component system, NtrC family, response regulator HydG